MNGEQAGWGEVDDDVSVRALHASVAGGVTFIDTAATYGVGRSERVLGRALVGRRDDVVLATKFGYVVDESSGAVRGVDVTPAAIHAACGASLRRLRTDRIDLYQLHVGDLAPAAAGDVTAVLDDLVTAGSIRHYGVSTDDSALARAFLSAPGCVAVQHQLNVLQDSPTLLDICAEHDALSITRGPLAMGLLAGHYDDRTRFNGADLRARGAAWMPYFTGGRPDSGWLRRSADIRDILVTGGRTPAQGALAWIWARSPVTVPIPGVRTVSQAEENAGALAYGPLTREQMAEIDAILDRK